MVVWVFNMGKLHLQNLTGAPSLRFQHLSLSVISFRKLCKSLKNQEIVSFMIANGHNRMTLR